MLVLALVCAPVHAQTLQDWINRLLPQLRPLVGVKMPDRRVETPSESAYRWLVAQRIAQASGNDHLDDTQAIVSGDGMVQVVIEIDALGNVANAWAYQATGDSLLANRAVGYARAASPVPAPPADLIGASQRVVIRETFLFGNGNRFVIPVLREPRTSSNTL